MLLYLLKKIEIRCYAYLDEIKYISTAKARGETFMFIKGKILYCCYDFVFCMLSCMITISTIIMMFYMLNFKFELAPISFSFGFLLLSSESVFRVYCNRIFANRYPELFIVLPDAYKDLFHKNQRSMLSVYIICGTIITLYFLMQERWLILLCFIIMSALSLMVEFSAMNIDTVIVTKKHLNYLECHLSI